MTGREHLIQNTNKRFQDSTHNLLSWFLDVRSVLLDREGEHRPAEIAQHIAFCYASFAPEPIRAPAIEKNPPRIPDSYFDADSKFRSAIKELSDFVNGDFAEFLTHFFVHGSMADGRYKKGWSDLDTFMVIKKEVLRDGRALSELRRLSFAAWPLFLKITPLQHHGFIVAGEDDLASYPTHYLPPEALDRAYSLKAGQLPIFFSVRSDHSLALGSLESRRVALREAIHTGELRHHPKDGIYLQEKFKNAENSMRQLFSLLGYVMTVPSYVLDGRGQACHKAESFARARHLFSDRAWSIIDKATRIRSEWQEREGASYQGNAVPLWLQDLLGPNYFEDCLTLLEEAVAEAGNQ
ncbi:MAG: nucleotidyltransferase domain-containing protein [Candidatus Sungbacteria bacterium]|nr:nucleotidyltransferase domain-containing protein [Candidatus Sungbacteria bacterium]